MKTINKTIEVYSFDELSDAAKDNVRYWLNDGDNFGAECVIDDAKCMAALMGIEISNIYYSGFSSQGDGACFEGSYSYKQGAAKAIKSEAPQDAVLHRIAEGLQAIQRKHFYKLHASIKHSGHYYHEYCTQISVYKNNDYSDDDAPANVAETVSDLLRDFMRWIYKQLEADYEYQLSDETVSENCAANEYQFDVNGNIIN